MSFKNLKKHNKGAVNTAVIFIIVIVALAALLTSSFSFNMSPNLIPGQTYTPEVPTPGDGKKNLQLSTLKFKKVETKSPQGNTCVSNKFNEEPDIFVGSDPAANGIATANGRIRVWIDDGNGGAVSSGEVIDANTGQILVAGDRNATDKKGANYYRWEPALYITPITSLGQAGPFAGDAENGGNPYFPQTVRGRVVNTGGKSSYLALPPIESPVGFDTRTRRGHGGNMAQFSWDVSALSLGPGLYRAQFVIHDGDGDLAVNCTTIQI